MVSYEQRDQQKLVRVLCYARRSRRCEPLKERCFDVGIQSAHINCGAERDSLTGLSLAQNVRLNIRLCKKENNFDGVWCVVVLKTVYRRINKRESNITDRCRTFS